MSNKEKNKRMVRFIVLGLLTVLVMGLGTFAYMYESVEPVDFSKPTYETSKDLRKALDNHIVKEGSTYELKAEDKEFSLTYGSIFWEDYSIAFIGGNGSELEKDKVYTVEIIGVHQYEQSWYITYKVVR